jgi:uncharacterized membrane protein YfcA
MAGAKLAEHLPPQRMRQIFALVLFVLGMWQALAAWWR